jgi:hypothetical protein
MMEHGNRRIEASLFLILIITSMDEGERTGRGPIQWQPITSEGGELNNGIL